MRPSDIKAYVFLVVGLVSGSSIAYVGLNKTLEKKWMNQAQNEINTDRELAARQNDKAKADMAEQLFAEEVADPDAVVVNNYTSITNRYSEPPVPVDLKKEAIVRKVESTVDNVFDKRLDPFVITQDAYLEELSDEPYRKVTITYFAGNGVYVDDDQEEIPRATELVGDAIKHFGDSSNDADIVYIRNTTTGVDYEVIRDENSFFAS